MQKMILNTDKLGKLEIKEIFFFFEHPHVFSCISSSGQYFLAARFSDRSHLLALTSEKQLYYAKMRKTPASTLLFSSDESCLISEEGKGEAVSAAGKNLLLEKLPYPGVCLCN